MNARKLDSKIMKMAELDQQIKLLKAELNTIKDELKTVMDDNGLDELRGSKTWCFYKDIVKTVADTDKLKSDGLYPLYSKQTEYKLFDYKVNKGE